MNIGGGKPCPTDTNHLSTYVIVDSAFNQAHNSKPPFLNDTLEAIFTDWFILYMQTGLRMSKWCQEGHILKKNGNEIPNKDNAPSASTLQDFAFQKSQVENCDNPCTIHITGLL